LFVYQESLGDARSTKCKILILCGLPKCVHICRERACRHVFCN